jgi:hypothetical protein
MGIRMMPEDSAHDKELLERYRRASDAKPAAPSDSVRAAILAEGRRIAEERAKSPRQRPLDVSRRAANDSRWKITAFGTAGAALVAALLFGPRLWEHAHVPALQTSTSSVAPSDVPRAPPANSPQVPAPAAAPAMQARAGKPVLEDRQASLAESAPAEKAQADNSQPDNSQADKKFAHAATEQSPSTAAGAPPARAPPAGAAQGDVSANRAPSARAKAADAAGDAAVNERDELGRTPLMLAVIEGRQDAVRVLLDRGADPNAADHSGRTPLQMAKQANRREIAALLERSGAR